MHDLSHLMPFIRFLFSGLFASSISAYLTIFFYIFKYIKYLYFICFNILGFWGFGVVAVEMKDSQVKFIDSVRVSVHRRGRGGTTSRKRRR